MKYQTIIVAGGTGSRMKSTLPKQFLELNGKAILLHTIQAFEAAFENAEIILVLHPDYLDYWEELILKHPTKTKIRVIGGGKTRFHSVKNGFDLITEKESIVGIHDGVRPFVNSAFLQKIYQTAETKGAVIPSIPLKDSIRKITGDHSEALDRSQLRAVQTPQCFRYTILEAAFQQEYRSDFTDDASVVERAGFPIHLIDGLETNIKITSPMDLKWASLIDSE